MLQHLDVYFNSNNDYINLMSLPKHQQYSYLGEMLIQLDKHTVLLIMLHLQSLHNEHECCIQRPAKQNC